MQTLSTSRVSLLAGFPRFTIHCFYPPVSWRALFTLLVVLISCKQPTDPPPPPPPAGPDTTSHDFSFRIDTLGDGGGDQFYDVAVIDENNIWAVGSVSLMDSTGEFSEQPYNVARWNGEEWTLYRFQFPQYNNDCSIAYITPALATAIFAFSSNDILISDGGSVSHWDGESLTPLPCLSPLIRDGYLRRIWGQSNDDFYVVGHNGAVVHFQGGFWAKLETGSSLNLLDVWGDNTDGKAEILAVASHPMYVRELGIFRIDGTMVRESSHSGIFLDLSGIWFAADKKYYVAGSGIFYKDSLSSSEWTGIEMTEYFHSNDIVANDSNDVVVVGAFGDFLHYNGSTWQNYPVLRMNGSWGRASYKGNTLAAVGVLGQRTVTVIAHR